MRWMKFTAMILLLPAGSCMSGASAPAICDGTAALRTAHAAALAQDGGELSVASGQALIMKLDAGCGD